MGGIEPAKTMITEALKAGKNVVSANKDLIAEYGKELYDAAKEGSADFLFEALIPPEVRLSSAWKATRSMRSWELSTVRLTIS